MSESDCSALRAALVAGERLGEELAAHLGSCAGCRGEAARFKRLLEILRDADAVEPPRDIDRTVRYWIEAGTDRPTIRPFFAAGLAAAAFLALIGAVAAALAQSGAAEYGSWLAVSLAAAYLSINGAATLPLLLMRTRRTRPSREVTP